MPTGLGDEQLWISATNDNTGTSTALNDLSASSVAQYSGSGVTVAADTNEGGTYALSFNGSSTRSWQYTPALQTNGGYFGWSVWFKADALGSTMSIVGGSSNTYKNGGLLYVDSSGNLIFSLNKGVTSVPNVRLTHATSLNAGQWYHAAATGDGTTARLYLDGVEVESGAFTSFPSSWERFMRLGSAGSGAGDSSYGSDVVFFDGLIDDARFYDRTLTPAEIVHLASSRGVQGSAFTGLGDELAWVCPTLNSGGVDDISGNGYNGTLEAGASIVSDVADGGTQAMSLTGSVGGCLTLDSSILPSIQDGRTVSYSCWYKNLSAGDEMIGFSTKGGGSNGWWVGKESVSSGTVTRLLARGGGYQASSTDLGNDFTGWRHLAWTIDGAGVVTGYQDGVANSVGTIPTPGVVGLTAYIGTTNQVFAAAHYQDDCRLYDRVLTQAEITHLASSRGVEGTPPVGLGDEQIWLCPSIANTAFDISGNGNNGTYGGGMGTVADTSNGGTRAYSFDGVDDGVQFYDNGVNGGGGAADFLGDGTFSVSLWYQSDIVDTGLAGYPMWGTRGRGGYHGYSGGMKPLGSNTRWRYMMSERNNFAGVDDLYFPPSPNDTSWHHVCWSSTAGVAGLYIDGVLVDTLNVGNTIPQEQTSLYLGKAGNWTYGNGLMDDVRMYDRTLTQSEITHLATSRGIEGSPGTPSAQYNAFITHAFKQLFQTRLR